MTRHYHEEHPPPSGLAAKPPRRNGWPTSRLTLIGVCAVGFLGLIGLIGLAPAASAGNSEPQPRGPSKVQNVMVEAGDGQLTVRWDEPRRTTKEGISRYEVRATPLIGDLLPRAVDHTASSLVVSRGCTILAGAELECTIGGLENNVPHDIRIWAISRRGPNGEIYRTTGTPQAEPETRRIVVRAYGERGEEEFEVRIGSTLIGEARTTSEYELYQFEASTELTGDLTVAFTNDFYDGWEVDRNLWIDWVGIGQAPKSEKPPAYVVASEEAAEEQELAFSSSRRDKRPGKGMGAHGRLIKIHSEQPNVYSEGAWSTGAGCSPGFRESERITCGGIFTYGVIAEDGSITDAQDPYLPEIPDDSYETMNTIRVRARGTVGGERFAVRNDGSTEVLAQIVVTREWRTYRIPFDEYEAKPVIAFMNDMDDNVHDFNLQVDWVKVFDSKIEAEDPRVWVHGTGSCETGNLQTDTMFCNGAWWFPRSVT